MDRCALFVDAGYVLADGAMAVHGTRHRESVAWDYAGLLQLLCDLARQGTGLPLLRCYWYEAAVEGRRTPDHDALADLPGLKLRLGRMRPGRREGVDTEVHRDLSTLARNRAISDAVIVSGEEDLAQVVGDIQDLGVRVTLVHITVDGNWTISRLLRQECDAIIEVGGTHLRPHVNLIAGAQPAHYHDQYTPGQFASKPLANGHGSSTGHGSYHALPAGHHQGPPAIYTSPAAAPEQEHAPGPQEAPSAAAGGAPALPRVDIQAQPASPGTGATGEQAAVGQPAGPGHLPAGPQPAGDQAQAGQASADRALAAQAPADHLPGRMTAGQAPTSQHDNAPHRQVPVAPHGQVPVAPHSQVPVAPHSQVPIGPHGQVAAGQQGQVPAGQMPAGQPPASQHDQVPPGQVPVGQDVPAATQDEPAQQRTPQAARPVPGSHRQVRELAAPPPGAGQPQLYAAPTPALTAPITPALPLSAPTPTLAGAALPTPTLAGAALSAPTLAGAAQSVPTLPAGPPEPAQAAPPGPPDMGREHDHVHGHPGRTPFVPTSPEPQSRRAPLARSAPPSASLSGPPAIAAAHAAGTVQPGTVQPGTVQSGAGPPGTATGPGQPGMLPAPYVPPTQGQYGGPQPGPPAVATATLAGAVQAAHAEGLDFGDSVARDAPALWLEAVLARKPRMPSDLEAQLLQGSALPIDFLLHDEVRSALRRGFWDALERSRR